MKRGRVVLVTFALSDGFALAQTAPRPQAAQSATWSIQAQKSEFDDSATVTISKRAETAISDYSGKPIVPSLLARCEEGKIEVWVHTSFTAQPELARIIHESAARSVFG